MIKPETLKSQTHLSSPKVDAKLRMFVNGSQEVNEIRCEHRGNLAIRAGIKPKIGLMREDNLSDIPPLTKQLKKKKSKNPPKDILTNVFIELAADDTIQKIEGELIRKGSLVSARVPLTRLSELAAQPSITNIETSRTLKYPDYRVANNYPLASTAGAILKDYKPRYSKKSDVIIGIIDVGGFDFSHPDFLDDSGNSRFISIWDQGGDFRKPPSKFGYGSEFTKPHLDAALRNASSAKVPPWYLEKQSQISVGSHGTHVASIAAGNNGICPHALIAGVLISLKPEDYDRRKSFYDSSSLVQAVDYLLDIAKKHKLPIAINISLGTNGHAHDGSDAPSRWIDSELLMPGRCIAVAAGNAGQDSPSHKDDFGYVMGRIHASGKIEASGLSADIFWNVVGNGISDMSENEMEIWCAPQDRIKVMIKPPGRDWLEPVKPNEYIENMQLPDGSFISIYNDLYHPSNGLNYISIYLSPNMNRQNVIPVQAGAWQVRLVGEEIRSGEYHAWIERDDPRPLGAIDNDRQKWNFPSFFSDQSNVDNTSVSSLACGRNIISVGNLDHQRGAINSSSSQGPTRDKRLKPEVIAPGTNITAAKAFAGRNDLWISMTGTSMASPLVCGIAASMLAIEPTLTASQVLGIIMRTSTPLPSMNYAWKNDCGFGVIDPHGCIEEAKKINTKKDLKPR